jgi:protoheme ferro-lyase
MKELIFVTRVRPVGDYYQEAWHTDPFQHITRQQDEEIMEA